MLNKYHGRPPLSNNVTSNIGYILYDTIITVAMYWILEKRGRPLMLDDDDVTRTSKSRRRIFFYIKGIYLPSEIMASIQS